ncbi:MAG: phenylacetate--CoA ligase family protein [Butyrivibrio sp.]|nr:phenylacetate--CoA ligase family protein [Butyrivibrio sp.]
MSLIHFVLKYYNKVPPELLNIFGPFYNLMPEKIRYTPTFSREKNEIERIHSLSEEELLIEENAKLQRIIQYAYNHTEYYKELFDVNGIDPKSIKTKSDLDRIPFLTKEILVNNRDRLISDEFKQEDLVYITTSGSTGVPTGFYVQKDSHIRDLAYTYYFFGKYGYTTKCKKLILRGKTFANQKRGKNTQWDSFKRELSINIFDMTDARMDEYCRAIEKYRPDVAYGYMSAMYLLCKHIEKRGGLNHKFKCFIGISETITAEQKEYVEKIIEAPVLTFYGMSERVIIAAQDHESGEYTPEPIYGITEIIDSNGVVINEENKSGELVGTSLYNYGMPLIRYKTGDMSEWINMSYRKKDTLKTIYGRKQKDLLINCDGVPVSMASLEVHSVIYDYMTRYQFYQEVKGAVLVRVVLNTGVNQEVAKKAIEETFTKRTMGKIIFSVEFVDSLKPKANGKYSIIDQRMNVEEYL